MKTTLLLIALLLLNGCVEFACYSNADYAVKEAQEFCKRANSTQPFSNNNAISNNVVFI